MIYLQTINKKWEPGKRIASHLDKKQRAKFEKYIAEEYVRQIQKSIDNQRFKGKWHPLSRPYLEKKKKKGYSLKTWEATSQLKKSLKVMSSKGLVVGFDRRVRHKESREFLYKIAIYLEFGDYRRPPRPLFRLVYINMNKNMRFYYNKFMKGGV